MSDRRHDTWHQQEICRMENLEARQHLSVSWPQAIAQSAAMPTVSVRSAHRRRTTETPYVNSPGVLPAAIQAADFDNGGAGVAYNMVSAPPSGSIYRSTGVFIQPGDDSGSGAINFPAGNYSVGKLQAGDWLNYTVNANSGTYNFDFRVACRGAGGRFHMEIDGVNVTGELAIPNTGGWQNYVTVSKNNVIIPASGNHVLRVVFDATGRSGLAGNFAWLRAGSANTQLTPPPVRGSWNLIFDDEFNSLNSSTWATSYWWDTNGGTQATFNPSQVSVSNGTLSITAINHPSADSAGVNNPYTSGLLTTGGIQGIQAPSFSFTYGYVECRSQIAPGQGMWSALWMLPTDHLNQYELDVFENLGRAPTTDQAFYHVGRANAASMILPAGSDLTAGYHTYGVDWEPNSITWYLDGKAMYSFTNASQIVNKPMYLILNLDVGGSWAGPLTSASPAQSTWNLDYLRVWQH